MKHLQKRDLSEFAIKKLGLDEITEVFWSEDRGKYVSANQKPLLSLALAGVDLVTISYATKLEEFNSVAIHGKRPTYATHYCLGPVTTNESVTSGERKHGSSEGSFPIVYFYPNEFMPFKKE